ncbi:MAG: hypothetical protein EA402_11610 [Planctomycetota bacterium]|nr:MAG: hypothetical protein EA402_11610 [Planctomycetota bacterium]
MWKLRLLAILLMAGGAGLIAFAVHIELTLRENRGRGFRRFLGNVFYSGDIDHYRMLVYHSLLFAPGLIISGLGIWAFVSWRKRVRQARIIERGLLELKPAKRKELLQRGLSGRRLARELENLQPNPAANKRKNSQKTTAP